LARSSVGLDALFKGRHYDEMMAERGLTVAHATIMCWVQSFAPKFEWRWNRFTRQSGDSWSVDETYIKIRSVWTYLMRLLWCV
jgi:transposase-like protein